MPDSRENTASSPLTHGPSPSEWQAAHESLAADTKLWPRLNWLGFQSHSAGAREMRECPCCGSQISKEVGEPEALEAMLRTLAVVQRTIQSHATSLRSQSGEVRS